MANDAQWVERLNNVSQHQMPGMVAMIVTHAEHGLMRARLEAEDKIVAPIGSLFAPAIVTLADTLCAYGTVVPEGALGFTTSELNCHFLSRVDEGGVLCEATLLHDGHTTQVWNAIVRAEDTGKLIAVFRCTQHIRWPQ
jgi:uncharacterized protein (TIGR00369 family)